MKPYTRSIIELFDGKKRFLIPYYQRQYAWKAQPQLELLWEDIKRAVARIQEDRSSLTPHFMGAIVIAQIKTYGKQVQAFEIVDGQQRLTTFQLLLSAFRDVAKLRCSRYAQEVEGYLLSDGVMEDPERERFKLWPSLADRRSFVAIIDPGADLDAIAPKPDDEAGTTVRRAVSAYEYFKAKIDRFVTDHSGSDEHGFELLFEALKDGLAIVSIELESGDDPQTIFETLNSRGVDLAPGDLMRNFIFQRAKGLGQASHSLVVDKLYEKHWLALDKDVWSQPASRGRQTQQRLDWMLTDHLSMQIGNIVSVENLFERYRRWILDQRPYVSVAAELESISATAAIEKRLFEQIPGDAIGEFGRFADAFDVSTAMPLVIFLATDPGVGEDLNRALQMLESYILRRDICGLNNKNYNRLFVRIVEKLRVANGNKVEELASCLSSGQSETDRWPTDIEWEMAWLGRPQYRGRRQQRIRYLFEAIEKTKRSRLSEDVTIKSPLTVEHIMPQSWQENWPIPGFEHLDDPEQANDPNYITKSNERNLAVDTIGNLTLLTQALNTSVSNGTFNIKMRAVRSHSSLALNRELNDFEVWDEGAIKQRGKALFQVAKSLWLPPAKNEAVHLIQADRHGLFPAHGTHCKFRYANKEFEGIVEGRTLRVNGFDEPFKSFSAASRAITQTQRNGWYDWLIADTEGRWTLADDWRRGVLEQLY